MNRSSTRSIYRIFLLVPILALALLFDAKAQSVSINTIKHETISQTQIVINYTPAGGATAVSVPLGPANPLTLAEWSVTLNGVAVAVTSVSSLGLNVVISIDASGINGAGVPYILPSQTSNVRVSYLGVGPGKLATLPGGTAPAGFANQQSRNDFGYSCDEFGFNKTR